MLARLKRLPCAFSVIRSARERVRSATKPLPTPEGRTLLGEQPASGTRGGGLGSPVRRCSRSPVGLYFGTCVWHPSTIETLAVIVSVAVEQAFPWRMISVGFVGSSYVHPFAAS